MSGWEAMAQGAPDPFFKSAKQTEAELAHEIVRTTGCSYCGATPGVRCRTRRGHPQALNPSHAHRERVEAYWRSQR